VTVITEQSCRLTLL